LRRLGRHARDRRLRDETDVDCGGLDCASS
jgi:hypothetical protein